VKKQHAAGELLPAIRAYLLTGAPPPRDAADEVREIEFERDRAGRFWKEHRRGLIAEGRPAGFVPFGADLFDAESASETLPRWRRHAPDPRGILRDGEVTPCPHCGRAGFEAKSCLS
jgi:hypothetical protein